MNTWKKRVEKRPGIQISPFLMALYGLKYDENTTLKWKRWAWIDSKTLWIWWYIRSFGRSIVHSLNLFPRCSHTHRFVRVDSVYWTMLVELNVLYTFGLGTKYNVLLYITNRMEEKTKSTQKPLHIYQHCDREVAHSPKFIHIWWGSKEHIEHKSIFGVYVSTNYTLALLPHPSNHSHVHAHNRIRMHTITAIQRTLAIAWNIHHHHHHQQIHGNMRKGISMARPNSTRTQLQCAFGKCWLLSSEQ